MTRRGSAANIPHETDPPARCDPAVVPGRMLTRLRPFIFWAHFATAVCAGAIILVMSATGVLLAGQRQLQLLADTRGLDAAPARGAALLAPEALLAATATQHTVSPTGIRWRNDPDAPVEVLYGRTLTHYVNGYTGALLGSGSARTRAFFSAVTDWHRWLGLRGSAQATGRAITGAANLAFLFLALSGFWLWWPRTLTLRALRGGLLFRRGLHGRARDFNWHTVIGFWSLVPLVVIIASAVVISYAWASAAVSTVAGEERPATEAPPIPISHDAADASQARAAGGFLLDRARAAMPEWRSITMQLPARSGAHTFLLDGGNGAQPHRQARLTLDEATGAVIRWETFASDSRAARVRSIMRYAHTGEVLGLPGQILAGIVSAGVMLMVWTGSALALRRARAWRGRRRRFGPGGRGSVARP